MEKHVLSQLMQRQQPPSLLKTMNRQSQPRMVMWLQRCHLKQGLA